ncbi:MAG TPA: DUF3014 domain-containing protein [Ottowia sp.]|mgnify:CR=1 FL=1|uniref:DUF3014 domain-containing protein n=1 Tax=Ottowia sp. TaxID=1898956 RepID=UPI002C43103C|nr:DUF3014 domain-containing protein [Ottowia sp.]HMN22131.1 DUF3014 domain-containing protein [Ottowia sp.]
MSNKTAGPRILGAVVVVAIAALIWWWFERQNALVVGTAPPAAPAPAASAPQQEPPATSPTEPAIEYPVPEPDEAEVLQPAEVAGALTDWLGRRQADSFLQTGDFARRLVATVDNLGRSYAPASLWPVNPAEGRFTVRAEGGATVIAADNANRYAPLVSLAEAVDVRQAVALYIRMYPLLQSAYEDLGFPKAHFNDRLIQVIDLLLASPEPAAPIAVRLTEVKGPEPSLRPWVRYEFADPALEALTAGQKIMVRVGAANERRLKARLAALRKELLAHGAPPR